MAFLTLSISSSALILVIFRLAGRYNIKLFPIIILNYFAAGIVGHLFTPHDAIQQLYSFQQPQWLAPAIAIGVLLIVMFFLMGISSQKAGVSVTSVASKMSVIVPVAFSIVYYSEDIFFLKMLGIGLALVAVLLSSLKKKAGQDNADPRFLLLPFLIFLGTGTIDALIKFTQQAYINPETSAAFTSFLFGVAFVLGVGASLFRRVPLRAFFVPKTFFTGIVLGLMNYASIYFLIRALETQVLDSSIIFGLNNIGVVALSVLIGLFFFREKLSPLNWAGTGLAFVSIYLLRMAG